MISPGASGRCVPKPRVLDLRVSPKAESAIDLLTPQQRKKLEWWYSRLKSDPFVGDQIPKDRIPEDLGRRHRMAQKPPNAWRFEPPLAFRGVYTVLAGGPEGVCVLVLEVLSHKEYDRLFGYH